VYSYVRPLLFRLDAERAHKIGTGVARVVQALSPDLVESMFEYGDAALGQSLWGLSFPNPVGLAAGFDKNATLVHFWEKLGFGFVEVGSVTAHPSSGNPRPRAFRLPEDQALINRMGLNNDGAERVAQRLRKLKARRTVPLGVNLAKTPSDQILGAAAVDDFRASFHRLAPLADYVTINISCPNTEDGKTFEEPDGLDALLSALFAERSGLGLDVPVLVKLAPPVSPSTVYDSQVEDVIAVAMTHGVQGFIASNTAPDRQHLTASQEDLDRIGRGGLSGAPLRKRSTQLVRYLYSRTGGEVPIIGVGGVASAEAAYAKLRSGASLVQLYTGLVYEGPGLIRDIKKGLVRLLERDGYSSVGQVVGVDAHR
jgi:dihydroorotate dehydrogenase